MRQITSMYYVTKQVKKAELREFYSVAFIDASVNSLTLGDDC